MENTLAPIADLPRAAKAREELRTPRAAGVAGIAFAILFIGSLALVRAPAGVGTATALAAWYTEAVRSRLVLVGFYGIPFAGIAFLWFIGVVRDRIGEREDRFFSTVFLGSGLLFVAMLFTAAACATAIAVRADVLGSGGPPTGQILQFSLALTYAFLYVYAARTAGVFMIVTSTIAWRTGSVPRWVAVLGYVIALLLLLSIRSFQLIILLFPLWVALLSLFILFTPGSVDFDDDAAEAPE